MSDSNHDHRLSGVILGVSGSVLSALFFGGLYEYLFLRGLINMTAPGVVLVFVWFIGMIGIVISEMTWGRRRRRRFMIGTSAAFVLAVLLVGLNRVVSWVPVTPSGAQVSVVTEIVTALRKAQQPHLGVQLAVDRSDSANVHFHFDISNTGVEDAKIDTYQWSSPDDAGDIVPTGYPAAYVRVGATKSSVALTLATPRDDGFRPRTIIADFQYHSPASAKERLWVVRCRFVLSGSNLSNREPIPGECSEQEGEITSTESGFISGLQRPTGTLALIFSGEQTANDLFIASNNRRYYYNAQSGTITFSDLFPDGVWKQAVSKIRNKSIGTHSVLVRWHDERDFISLSVD